MSSIRAVGKKIIGSCISFGVIKAASFCKISFIIGSQAGLFSATSIAVPVLGAFTGQLGALLTFFLGYGLRMVLSGGFALSYFAHHLPGLFAALYWNSHSIWVRLLLPAVCMVAFISHPVGGQAFTYSLYWLIPIFLYFFPQKSLFFQALGSTFIAHAVGSVVWIYTVPMTAAQWTALIPVVIVERLLFAAGMVIAYSVITYCARLNVVPSKLTALISSKVISVPQ